MVADQGGRTYTKIAPPNTELRSLAPSVGGAFDPQLDPKRLRLDPGLRHLQGKLNAALLQWYFLIM